MNEETINHIKSESFLQHGLLSPFFLKLCSYSGQVLFSSESKQQVIKFLHPHMKLADRSMLDLLKFYVQLTNFMAVFIICLAAIIAQKGSDAWWYMTVEDLLPEKYREKASDYEKGTDTMDVWFDSGIRILKCQKYSNLFFSFLCSFFIFGLREKIYIWTYLAISCNFMTASLCSHLYKDDLKVDILSNNTIIPQWSLFIISEIVPNRQSSFIYLVVSFCWICV